MRALSLFLVCLGMVSGVPRPTEAAQEANKPIKPFVAFIGSDTRITQHRYLRIATREEWLGTLNTNLVSGAQLVELARFELAKHKGAVVNLSSISAYAAQTGRWTYPVSKAAILHLTRLQAMDYAPDGIRVNSLVAGWTVSDPIAGLAGGDWNKADRVAAEFHLLGRLGRASEVAAGVLFLCSDHASFTTGSELRVEGGYLAMGPEQATPAIAKLTGGQATVTAGQ